MIKGNNSNFVCSLVVKKKKTKRGGNVTRMLKPSKIFNSSMRHTQKNKLQFKLCERKSKLLYFIYQNLRYE